MKTLLGCMAAGAALFTAAIGWTSQEAEVPPPAPPPAKVIAVEALAAPVAASVIEVPELPAEIRSMEAERLPQLEVEPRFERFSRAMPTWRMVPKKQRNLQ